MSHSERPFMPCRIVLSAAIVLLTCMELHAGQPTIDKDQEKVATDAAQVRIVTIGITALENRNPLLEADWFSTAAADLLTAQLSRNATLSVPERSAVEELSREAALASNAAGPKGTATDFVLGGSYSVENDQLRMELTLSDQTGRRIWGDSFLGPQSTYSQLCRQAARAIMLALDKGNTAPELDMDAPPPLAAVVSLYRGKRALERGDTQHALSDFLLAAKSAPDYVEAWRQLGETLETLGYRAAAVKAYERAVDINKNQPNAARTLWELGLLAEDLPDPAIARGIYSRLRMEFPFSKSKIRDNSGNGFRSYAALATAREQRLDKLAAAAAPASTGAPSTMQDPVTVKHIDLSNHFRQTGEYAVDWPAARLTDGVKTNLTPSAINLIRSTDRKSFAPMRIIPILPADPAKPFQSIGLKCTSTKLKLTLAAAPLGAIFNLSPLTAELVPEVSSTSGEKHTMTAQLVLDTPYSSGFYLLVRGDTTITDLSATATCRPIRPGVLRLETMPAKAIVSLDRKMVAYTPCIIRDLPASSAHIQLEVPPLLAGEIDVKIAGGGETRLTWEVPFREDWRKTEFQMQTLVRPAGVDPIKSIHTAWHPRLGWVLAWSEDGDILLATSQDGNTWTKPKRLGAPIRTIQSEDALALLVAPESGRGILVFRRDTSLLVSSSDDLLQWSIPKVLSAGSDAQQIVKLSGAAVNALGHFILFVTETRRNHEYGQIKTETLVSESFDGQVWSTPKLAMSLHDQNSYVASTADGQFELVVQKQTNGPLLRRTTSDGLVWSDNVESDSIAERSKARWSNPATAAVLILAAQKNNILVIPEEGTDGRSERKTNCSGFDVAWSRPAADQSPRVMLASIQAGEVFVQLSRAPGDAGTRQEPVIQYEQVATNDSAPKPAAAVTVTASTQAPTTVEKVTGSTTTKKSPAAAASPESRGIGKWLPWVFGGLIAILAAVLSVLQKRDAKPQTPEGGETP